MEDVAFTGDANGSRVPGNVAQGVNSIDKEINCEEMGNKRYLISFGFVLTPGATDHAMNQISHFKGTPTYYA